jgi:hypothetical protein
VEPGASLGCECGDLTKRIERPGVHVSRLGADDRRPGARLEGPAELVGPHPPLFVHGDPRHPLAPESQHPERNENRGVRLVADDDVDRRRVEQPARLHVIAHRVQDPMTGGRQTGEVGHGPTGDESNARCCRQPEE